MPLGERPWLGQRVRHIRLTRGYSQTELARRAGLNRHTIRYIERDSRPVLNRTLRRLAKALDVHFSTLTVPD